MNTEKRLEIEVKVRVAALPPCRKKLLALGAELAQVRIREHNLVLDTPGHGLKQQGILLRLRRAGKLSSLTMKTPVGQASAYKVRAETETVVADFAAMKKILRGIGLRTVFTYEKYRETFRLGGVLVMLDQTPIGDFIEIEGLPPAIDDVASRLGFSPADYITDSYRQLFLGTGRSGNMIFAP